jgi:hypothetical protein
MYGNKSDEEEDMLEDETEQSQEEAAHATKLWYEDVSITAEVLRRYRKSGPMGKLHNHGVCFNYSSQLVQAFHDAQRGLSEPVLQWSHNVCTRWQSDYDMADLALKKQVALNRLHNTIEEQWQREGGRPAARPVILDERLSAEDWKIVTAIHRLLKPFKAATLQLQGNGRTGSKPTSGGFDDYFPTFEHLLDHLEEAKKGIIYEDDENGSTHPINFFADLQPETVKDKKLGAFFSQLKWAIHLDA